MRAALRKLKARTAGWMRPGERRGSAPADPKIARVIDTAGLTNIHYASSGNLLPGWLNVDLASEQHMRDRGKTAGAYRFVDLLQPHPFMDQVFAYGYSEDFLEHLTQDEAIIFLCEAYRTFKPGGVLRLSTPGLEGVLRRHYRAPDYGGAVMGQHEAYRLWGHVHFFAREELAVVARHVGFSAVDFRAFGESAHEPLAGLDSREHQRDLNHYVELTR